MTEGGHYVDPDTLRNNFFGNLEKLNTYHKLVDDMTIVDTSQINNKILFRSVDQRVEVAAPRHELPEWFTQYLLDIVALIP